MYCIQVLSCALVFVFAFVFAPTIHAFDTYLKIVYIYRLKVIDTMSLLRQYAHTSSYNHVGHKIGVIKMDTAGISKTQAEAMQLDKVQHNEMQARVIRTTYDDMSGVDKLVLLTLLGYYNMTNGLCCPSIKTVAKVAGISDRTVIRSVQSLKEVGYLDYTKGSNGMANNYFLKLDKVLALKGKY